MGDKGIIFEAFLAFLLDQLVWKEHPNIVSQNISGPKLYGCKAYGYGSFFPPQK